MRVGKSNEWQMMAGECGADGGRFGVAGRKIAVLNVEIRRIGWTADLRFIRSLGVLYVFPIN